MSSPKKSITILVAEDDPDDQMLIAEAFKESRLKNPIKFVGNGLELLDELRTMQADGGDMSRTPNCLVLLDLNMPKMDGREVLRKIKQDSVLRRVQVVVLTTSQADEDIVRSYDLGVSGFVSKPMEFIDLLEVIQGLQRYWLEIVELP